MDFSSFELAGLAGPHTATTLTSVSYRLTQYLEQCHRLQCLSSSDSPKQALCDRPLGTTCSLGMLELHSQQVVMLVVRELVTVVWRNN